MLISLGVNVGFKKIFWISARLNMPTSVIEQFHSQAILLSVD